MCVAPPFHKFVVTLMVGVRNGLAELFITPRTADILRWTSSDNFEQEGIVEADGRWKDLFDFHGVRPAVAEVIEIFE